MHAALTPPPPHHPLTATDAAGQATTYTYNNDGKVLTTTRTRAGVPDETLTHVYYLAGSASGNVGRLKEMHGPGGLAGPLLAFYTYDPAGRLRTARGADDYTATHYYDSLDRPLRTVFPDGTYVQATYSKLDAEWTRDRMGRWTQTLYDQERHVQSVRDPLGRTTHYEWCHCGALESITDARGHKTEFDRDVEGRVTQKKYEDGKFTTYTYDAHSGLPETTTDEQTQVTHYTRYPDSNLQSVSYTSATGAPLAQTRPDGTKINATITYGYDQHYDRLQGMQDGTGLTIYSYYPVTAPAPATQTTPAVTWTLGAGRLQKVEQPGDPLAGGGQIPGVSIEYAYDEYGRTVDRTISRPADTVGLPPNANTSHWSYDALGRTGAEANPLSRTVADPLAAFAYGYAGSTGRLTGMTTTPTGFNVSYGYHHGVPTPTDAERDFRLATITAKFGAGVLRQDDYSYDVGGEIKTWTQRGPGAGNPRRYELDYDPAEQLTGAALRDMTANVILKQYGYRYDEAGNRAGTEVSTQQAGGGYAVALTTDTNNPVNQLTSRAGGSGAMTFEGTVNEPAKVTVGGQAAQVWKNGDNTFGFRATATLAAGVNSVEIKATDASNNTNIKHTSVTVAGAGLPALSYDANGNTLNDGTRNYVWDAANQMVAIIYGAETAGNRTEFTYDGAGRRVRMVEYENGNATLTRRFVWAGLSIVEERDAANAPVKRYYPQGFQTLNTQPSPLNTFYSRDHLGSIRQHISATTGAVQASYNYDPYGNLEITSGPAPDFAYTGHLYHARSGLYFAPYRAYSAELGRWMSRDPNEEQGGLNLYGYVDNNVLITVDRTGLAPEETFNNQLDSGKLDPRKYKLLDQFNKQLEKADSQINDPKGTEQNKEKWRNHKKKIEDRISRIKKCPNIPTKLLGLIGVVAGAAAVTDGLKTAYEKLKNCDELSDYDKGELVGAVANSGLLGSDVAAIKLQSILFP